MTLDCLSDPTRSGARKRVSQCLSPPLVPPCPETDSRGLSQVECLKTVETVGTLGGGRPVGLVAHERLRLPGIEPVVASDRARPEPSLSPLRPSSRLLARSDPKGALHSRGGAVGGCTSAGAYTGLLSALTTCVGRLSDHGRMRSPLAGCTSPADSLLASPPPSDGASDALDPTDFRRGSTAEAEGAVLLPRSPSQGGGSPGMPSRDAAPTALTPWGAAAPSLERTIDAPK